MPGTSSDIMSKFYSKMSVRIPGVNRKNKSQKLGIELFMLVRKAEIVLYMYKQISYDI